MNTSIKLSVIVNFYNMQREARRTLYSLCTPYQWGVDPNLYEVIAVDNGSSTPLDKAWVESHGSNFSYHFFQPDYPSPCAAINYAARYLARGEYLCICIDGARILSPGILYYMFAAIRGFKNPFVYTLGMHIGNDVQNNLIHQGYNQDVENKLIQTTRWRENGYELFSISSFAISSKDGFFSPVSESNCCALSVQDFFEIGGLNEAFRSAGGGLVNLDFFNTIHEKVGINSIRLLGEATFHQFHGGVATNKPFDDAHPIGEFIAEYERIKGRSFSYNQPIQHVLGNLKRK